MSKNSYKYNNDYNRFNEPNIPKRKLNVNEDNTIFSYIREGNLNKIKNFNGQINSNAEDKDKNNFIHAVFDITDEDITENMKLDMVKYFVENIHVPINGYNVYNITPIHLAAKYQYSKIFKYLLEKGANVNVVDNKDMTPLHYIVTGKPEKCVDNKVKPLVDLKMEKEPKKLYDKDEGKDLIKKSIDLLNDSDIKTYLDIIKKYIEDIQRYSELDFKSIFDSFSSNIIKIDSDISLSDDDKKNRKTNLLNKLKIDFENSIRTEIPAIFEKINTKPSSIDMDIKDFENFDNMLDNYLNYDKLLLEKNNIETLKTTILNECQEMIKLLDTLDISSLINNIIYLNKTFLGFAILQQQDHKNKNPMAATLDPKIYGSTEFKELFMNKQPEILNINIECNSSIDIDLYLNKIISLESTSDYIFDKFINNDFTNINIVDTNELRNIKDELLKITNYPKYAIFYFYYIQILINEKVMKKNLELLMEIIKDYTNANIIDIPHIVFQIDKSLKNILINKINIENGKYGSFVNNQIKFVNSSGETYYFRPGDNIQNNEDFNFNSKLQSKNRYYTNLESILKKSLKYSENVSKINYSKNIYTSDKFSFFDNGIEENIDYDSLKNYTNNMIAQRFVFNEVIKRNFLENFIVSHFEYPTSLIVKYISQNKKPSNIFYFNNSIFNEISNYKLDKNSVTEIVSSNFPFIDKFVPKFPINFDKTLNLDDLNFINNNEREYVTKLSNLNNTLNDLYKLMFIVGFPDSGTNNNKIKLKFNQISSDIGITELYIRSVFRTNNVYKKCEILLRCFAIISNINETILYDQTGIFPPQYFDSTQIAGPNNMNSKQFKMYIVRIANDLINELCITLYPFIVNSYDNALELKNIIQNKINNNINLYILESIYYMFYNNITNFSFDGTKMSLIYHQISYINYEKTLNVSNDNKNAKFGYFNNEKIDVTKLRLSDKTYDETYHNGFFIENNVMDKSDPDNLCLIPGNMGTVNFGESLFNNTLKNYRFDINDTLQNFKNNIIKKLLYSYLKEKYDLDNTIFDNVETIGNISYISDSIDKIYEDKDDHENTKKIKINAFVDTIDKLITMYLNSAVTNIIYRKADDYISGGNNLGNLQANINPDLINPTKFKKDYQMKNSGYTFKTGDYFTADNTYRIFYDFRNFKEINKDQIYKYDGKEWNIENLSTIRKLSDIYDELKIDDIKNIKDNNYIDNLNDMLSDLNDLLSNNIVPINDINDKYRSFSEYGKKLVNSDKNTSNQFKVFNSNYIMDGSNIIDKCLFINYDILDDMKTHISLNMVNQKDKQAKTPIFYAIDTFNKYLIEKLTDMGSKVTGNETKNYYNKTPVQYSINNTFLHNQIFNKNDKFLDNLTEYSKNTIQKKISDFYDNNKLKYIDNIFNTFISIYNTYMYHHYHNQLEWKQNKEEDLINLIKKYLPNLKTISIVPENNKSINKTYNKERIENITNNIEKLEDKKQSLNNELNNVDNYDIDNSDKIQRKNNISDKIHEIDSNIIKLRNIAQNLENMNHKEIGYNYTIDKFEQKPIEYFENIFEQIEKQNKLHNDMYLGILQNFTKEENKFVNFQIVMSKVIGIITNKLKNDTHNDELINDINIIYDVYENSLYNYITDIDELPQEWNQKDNPYLSDVYTIMEHCIKHYICIPFYIIILRQLFIIINKKSEVNTDMALKIVKDITEHNNNALYKFVAERTPKLIIKSNLAAFENDDDPDYYYEDKSKIYEQINNILQSSNILASESIIYSILENNVFTYFSDLLDQSVLSLKRLFDNYNRFILNEHTHLDILLLLINKQ